LSELDLTLPNIKNDAFATPDPAALRKPPAAHKPRILLLYGSVRPRSYSRFLTFEAARLLVAMGAEPKIFDPSGLPLPDDTSEDHPKVKELRDLVAWSEGRSGARPNATVP